MNIKVGRIYTVVDVMRGVAVGAYSFRRARDAYAYAERLLDDYSLSERLDNDVRVFAAIVDARIPLLAPVPIPHKGWDIGTPVGNRFIHIGPVTPAVGWKERAKRAKNEKRKSKEVRAKR